MILLMLACAGAPYPEYWPDKSAYPAISRLEPDTIDSRGGGWRRSHVRAPGRRGRRLLGLE